MRLSIKDIAYDTQVEGTKRYYLYTAINTFKNKDVFLTKIADKFQTRLYWRLSEQLYGLLCHFSNDGFRKADDAIERKYQKLKKQLPLMRGYNLSNCE